MRKAKKVGLIQKVMAKLGYVPAPKKRNGTVNVAPYTRKAPKAKGQVIGYSLSGPAAGTKVRSGDITNLEYQAYLTSTLDPRD